jgi:hypothetical protein
MGKEDSVRTGTADLPKQTGLLCWHFTDTVRGGDIVIQGTSCSSGQDISHILVNAKVHYVLTGSVHLNVSWVRWIECTLHTWYESTHVGLNSLTILPVFVAACQNEVLYPVTICPVLTPRGSTVLTLVVWRAEVNRRTKVTSNDVAVKPAVLLRRIWQGWVHMSVLTPTILTAA